MRVLIALAIDSLENCGGKLTDTNRIATASLRRVVVRKGFDANHLRRGGRHILGLDAEAMAKIGPAKRVIPILGRRAQKRGCIGPLIFLSLPPDGEFGAADDLRYPYLRRITVDLFFGANNAEDAVSLLLAGARSNAGAEGELALLIPAPAGLMIRVVRVGAQDVPCLAVPLNPERI
jgi:hypothetical protein